GMAPGTDAPLCVGAEVNGIMARPRHRPAPIPHRAPSTITPTPTSRVNAAECHESANEYRSGPFHRMVSAANPRTIPTQKSKPRLIGPPVRCPADAKLAEPYRSAEPCCYRKNLSQRPKYARIMPKTANPRMTPAIKTIHSTFLPPPIAPTPSDANGPLLRFC